VAVLRLRTLPIALLLATLCGPANAIDLADGQVRIHGYLETQLRARNAEFRDEFDLAQWYNVANAEVEIDFAPEGVGPFDLIQGFVRVEGRYDAIYSKGFGIFPSVDTYGDFSNHLPEDLSDAVDAAHGGSQPVVDRFGRHSVRRIGNAPLRLGPRCQVLPDGRERCRPGERQGFPDYDEFFRQRGPDNRPGNVDTGIVGARFNPVTGEESEAFRAGVPRQRSDDPARHALEGTLGFEFAFRDGRGPRSARTVSLGPWLPRNFFRERALNPDVANPFRGRVAPSALADRIGESGMAVDGLETNFDGVRFYDNDPGLAALPGFRPSRIDPRHPFIAFVQDAPPDIVTDFQGEPFRDSVPLSFGGDFSGTVACVDPTGSVAGQIRDGSGVAPREANCVPGARAPGAASGSYQEPLVARLSGGAGEAPFRPAPDTSHLTRFDRRAKGQRRGALRAQGLYIPSRGLQRTLRKGDLDPHQFNLSETRRAFNRGASQRTGELKEAYLDLETLESRLWLRLGLQNIVWGKTELFRNTDLWNPQDLALSALPSLEESRIALWALRGVYSFYDLGSFEDVRLELAVSLDRFVPADIGSCGEPYAPDSTCTITNGMVSHGLLGAGVAGVDRPEDPFRDVRDIEVGGRLEWRWDRFSFALTDFWGYSDLPYLDSIFYYDRGVDLDSGRPVVGPLLGSRRGRCRNLSASGVPLAGEIAPDQRHGSGPGAVNPNGLRYNSSFASHPLSVTPGGVLVESLTGTSIDSIFDPMRGGVGFDDDCLRPGGAPGEPGAFRFDAAALDATNALYNHAANQQLFAWICLATQGIEGSLDTGACSFSVFGSPALLDPLLFPAPLVEMFSVVNAGDRSGSFTQAFLGVSYSQQRGSEEGVLPAIALASTNRLFNHPLPGQSLPVDLDGNGVAADNSGCDVPGGPCDLGGFDGFRSLTQRLLINRDPLTLDSTLGNEQRALLGCGPFFASRCDSSLREALNILGQAEVIGSGGNELGAKQNGDAIYGEFGGVDLLNAEASALLQSWPGFEGTRPGYFVTDRIPAPGTIGAADPVTGISPGFDGGPVCSRRGGLKLPGCRGVSSLRVVRDSGGDPLAVRVEFETGYRPHIDGCVIGTRILRGNGDVVPVSLGGSASPELASELELCNQATTQRTVAAAMADGITSNPNCQGRRVGFLDNDGQGGDDENLQVCNATAITLEQLPLIHPLAGCIDSPVQAAPGNPVCDRWMFRNLTEEFLAGTGQLFQNELAAVSWNFLQFLVVTSCNSQALDLDGFNRSGIQGNPSAADDPECFVAGNVRTDPSDPRLTQNLAYKAGRCSLVTPQFCKNVKNFFAVAGVASNRARAGGNARFGRRTFLWHSGGEAVLRYAQRNVLGFSMDFAEDTLKTNWGMELTWVEREYFADGGSFDGVSESDTVNLTISVDRPTFIRFLNPNRTFFFNSQWFLNYIPSYGSRFTATGPLNLLFTFTASTGYYQDRLQPSFTALHDVRSASGAAMPALTYRYSESFSVTVGLLYFWGRTELRDMPIRDLTPVTNRTGRRAYKVGVENSLSQVRRRDELYLRARWTF